MVLDSLDLSRPFQMERDGQRSVSRHWSINPKLVLGSGGLSAWRVECKPFYQGHNNRKRKRQQKQYSRKR